MTGPTVRAAEYDAFISYSHAAHAELAAALERGLEGLGRSWRKRRALNVYRDQTGQGAAADLLDSLREKLDRSRFLVLLASAEAAGSWWVEQEIRHWLDAHGTENLVIALVSGEIVWDDGERDFNWRETTALPPALAKTFANEPKYVDLRRLTERTAFDLRDPQLLDATAELAAPIHGVDKDELIGEDLRQHTRAKRLRRAAVGALAALTVLAVVGGVFAWQQRGEARRRATISDAQRLAAVSELLTREDPVEGAAFALASLRRANTPEGDDALAAALHRGDRLPIAVPGHQAEVTGLDFSRDGSLLASGDSSGELRLMDVPRSRFVARAPNLEPGKPYLRSINDVAFYPDGRALATVDPHGTLKVWSVPDLKLLGSVQAHDVASVDGYARPAIGALAVDVSPDGSAIATGGADGRVRLWRWAGRPTPGTVVRDYEENGVSAVAFVPGRRLLAVGGGTGRLSVLDLDSGRTLSAVQAHTGPVNRVSVDRTGKRLVSSGDDGLAIVWALEGDRLRLLARHAHPNSVAQAVFSGDGTRVYSGGWDNRVVGWAPGGKADPEVFGGHVGSVAAVAASPNGRSFASAGWDGIIRLWSPGARHSYIGELAGVGDDGRAAAFSDDGRLIAMIDRRGLRFVDSHTGRAALRSEAFAARSPELDFAGSKRILVTSDSGIFVFDLDAGRPRRRWSQPGEVVAASFYARGRGVAIAYSDGTVEFRRASDGVLEDKVAAVLPALGAMAIDQAGNRLAAVTYSGDRAARNTLWDLRHRKVISSFAAYPTVAMSRNGRVVAAAQFGRIELLDARTGAELKSLRVGDGQVNDLAFLPGDRLLVTGYRSGFVRVWNVESGARVGRALRVGPGELDDLAVDPVGGRFIAVAGGVVRSIALWELDTDELVARACRHIGRNLDDSEWDAAIGTGSKPPVICPNVPPNALDRLSR